LRDNTPVQGAQAVADGAIAGIIVAFNLISNNL
jgi:hypothetical protein